MSVRRMILRKLKRLDDKSPETKNFALASSFMRRPRDKLVLVAINELLAEELLLGTSVEGQQLAVQLNKAKMTQVNAELRTDWRSWLALVVAILGTAAAFLALR